jgi:hypothetical protein
MKGLLLTCCLALGWVGSAAAQATGLNPGLARVIDSLYLADQRTVSIKPADSAAAAYQRAIRTNFPLVEKILHTYSYPTYSLVGQASGQHYFLLVQHSDFNLPFQQRALKLMRGAVRRHEASGQQYAYLVDRIALNQGKPQVYGTQVVMSGNTQVKPCLAPAKLNERRKAVGLEPIEDYLKKCNAAFYRMNPQQSAQPVGN